MSATKGNKAKGRQSSHNAKYYEAQFHRTERNKLRRAAKRQRIANSPKTAERRRIREEKAHARYVANCQRKQQREAAAVLAKASEHSSDLAALLNQQHDQLEG